MKFWYTASLLLSLAFSAGATTLYVDGPGDGDSDGTDDFDAISDALFALGEGDGNDAQPDEVRIMVKPDEIDDISASKLARDITQKIQDNLVFPGQIKVVVVRETRAVEFAR